MSKVCGVCEEPVVSGSPVRSGWSLKVPEDRMKFRHPDGEPLCPEMGTLTDGTSGYVPCLPKGA